MYAKWKSLDSNKLSQKLSKQDVGNIKIHDFHVSFYL